MNDNLFPESELRAFLKQRPAPAPDLGFESAVLSRIYRQERRALLFAGLIVLAGLALLVAVAVPSLINALIHWSSLLGFIRQFFNAIRPLQNVISILILCAHSIALAAPLFLRPLIIMLALLFLLAALLRSLLARLPFRSTQLFI